MKTVKAWALCAVWMLFIFVMSATPGPASSAQSGFFSDMLISICSALPGSPKLSDEIATLIVRKGAHMFEYAVLFLLYRYALSLGRTRHSGLTALLLCALYASTDEYHQLFVSGRGGSPIDVAIDTTGAALGWIGWAIFSPIIARFWRTGKRIETGEPLD